MTKNPVRAHVSTRATGQRRRKIPELARLAPDPNATITLINSDEHIESEHDTELHLISRWNAPDHEKAEAQKVAEDNLVNLLYGEYRRDIFRIQVTLHKAICLAKLHTHSYEPIEALQQVQESLSILISDMR